MDERIWPVLLDEDLLMTSINTNAGKLMARTHAAKLASRTETSMESLSSGLRIYGAAERWLGSLVAGVSKVPSKLIWRFSSANLIAKAISRNDLATLDTHFR